MPAIHSNLTFLGKRIRGLLAAVNDDEPLRKAEADAGTLPTIADNTLLANTSGGTAAPIATTLSLLLDEALGNTQGQIITRNGSTWTVLSPGTSGYVLTSAGSGTNVSWQPSSGGSGGGTTKVTKSAVSLGTQAVGSTYTYTTVASTVARGLMTQFIVTSSSPTGPYDVVVRGAGNDSGTLWLQADDIGQSVYSVSLPVYYENDVAAQDFFVGIRNRGSASATYTLTNLRLEKFA